MLFGQAVTVGVNANTGNASSSVSVNFKSSAVVAAQTANSVGSVSLANKLTSSLNTGTANSTSSIVQTLKSSLVVNSSTENVDASFVVDVGEPPKVVIEATTDSATSQIVIEQIIEQVIGAVTEASISLVDFDLWEEYVPEIILKVSKQNSVFDVETQTIGKVKTNNIAVVEKPKMVWRV